MDPNAPISTRLLFCISLLFIGSCQKIHFEDFIHPDNTLKQCRVKQALTFNIYDNDTLTWDFKYNSRGNPISITPSLISTGSPELFFRYDNHGRITDYFGAYTKEIGAGEFWVHYVYQGNKIVRAISRAPVELTNGEPVVTPGEATTVHYYEYDAFGRVIRDSVVFSWGSNPHYNVLTSYYNSSENLAHVNNAVEGSGTFNDEDYYYTDYDDKVNINRTNRIWMIVNEDYSVNNPKAAESYNHYGLPTSFRPSAPGFNRFISSYFNYADIKYECK